MSFVKFERKGRASKPMIGIGRHGTITINDICYSKYFKDAKNISFYYDPDRKIIGMKPETTENNATYPMRIQATGGAVISGRGFLRYFGIELNKATRFEPRWNEQEKFVEIDIKKNEKG